MKVGIIGLGLMGASFARALLKKGICQKIYGADVSESVLKKAELMRIIHERLYDKTAAEVDLLVYCAFPDGLEQSVTPLLPHLKEGAIVTDFCGIKRPVVALFKRLSDEYPHLNFIGGHPMAGREFSGLEHSSVTLFEKASMILTPVKSDIFFLERIKKFYLDLGFGKVILTDAENHDKMIAFTSQLCHIVSNNYIKNESAQLHDGYSAGSYKDLTRVARLNSQMWADLMFDNKDNILSELSRFIDNLTQYKVALEKDDKAQLQKLLEEGNQRKLSIDGGNKNETKN